MKFLSREDAGQKLGAFLVQQGTRADWVLGLPRGGVIVAAQVARALGSPLDVLIVRKIGHPLQREFAVGAIAECDVVILDVALSENAPVSNQFKEVILEETQRLRSYEQMFRAERAVDSRKGTVIIVDDGLATGATTEAAVASVRKQGAGRVIIAAPVASRSAVQRLSPLAESVMVLSVDPHFIAVGAYYQSFETTSDDEVLAVLRAARAQGGGSN